MPQIIKAQWKPTKNNIQIMQFGPGNGQLQLLLDKYPDEVYQQAENYFYGLDGDFVNIYEWKPGTTRGFAGHEIVLNMIDGTSKTFKGSLWSPSVVKSNDIPRFCAVSITTEPEVMERGHTFYSSNIQMGRYVELRAALGVPVSIEDLS